MSDSQYTVNLTGIERGSVAHALQREIRSMTQGFENARKDEDRRLQVLLAVDIEALKRVLVKLGWTA